MWVWVQLAAGEGTRLGQKRPKQFLRLHKKPLLIYAIEAFLQVAPKGPVVVLLPLTHFRYGENILRKAFPKIPLYLSVGGATRSASTEAALHLLTSLELLSEEHVIAFHDAARPFPSPALIRKVFEAGERGAAVCGLPIPFSLRKVSGESSQALPREGFWEVQTPQAFRGDVLAAAWAKLSPTAEPHFTDEGSWIEAAGFPVTMIAGEPSNFKITYPVDWEAARAWAKRQAKA